MSVRMTMERNGDRNMVGKKDMWGFCGQRNASLANEKGERAEGGEQLGRTFGFVRALGNFRRD